MQLYSSDPDYLIIRAGWLSILSGITKWSRCMWDPSVYMSQAQDAKSLEKDWQGHYKYDCTLGVPLLCFVQFQNVFLNI